MKLAIGSDEQTPLTAAVIERLRTQGHELRLVGPLAGAQTAWPEVAQEVAEAVTQKRVEEGILFCWTGTGVSIAANKVPGIRAALCDDAETAKGARLWNQANVLCLSLRRTSPALAAEILDAWFGTSYQANPEDDACLRSVRAIEAHYSAGTPTGSEPA